MLLIEEDIKGGINSQIPHFLPDCIAFNQSALCHEQHEDVIHLALVLFRVDPVRYTGEMFNSGYVLPCFTIGGFRGEAEGTAAPLFSCIFKMFLYDFSPSDRPLSVVIIIQLGFNFIQFRSFPYLKYILC